jgi:D(-)-tartrate dehydratase
MRIVEIRECAIPLKSSLRNSSFDFSEMTTSVVAVITDAFWSSQSFNAYLGNGQSLHRVTTEVPRGRRRSLQP